MKKLFRGRVRLILLLAVLLAAATALTAALSGTAWGSRTVQAVLTPFRSGFSALTRQAERYYNYLFNYESLSAENDYLRRQISSMENEVRTADSLQRENERLKELLGLQEEHEDYRFNEAYIVSWDSSSWKSTFTIGKGTRSGPSRRQTQVMTMATRSGCAPRIVRLPKTTVCTRRASRNRAA